MSTRNQKLTPPAARIATNGHGADDATAAHTKTTTPDAATLGQKMIAAHATREQMKALHTEFETKFSALLDSDQQVKFQKMQAMRQQFRGGPRSGGDVPPADQ